MGKDKASYLSRIEWEEFQRSWNIERLTKPNTLPPGAEKAEVWRNDDYNIRARITGTRANLLQTLTPPGPPGTVIYPIEIAGTSDLGMYEYKLIDCYSAPVAVDLFSDDFEVDLRIGSARKVLHFGPRRTKWLTEWYLNSARKVLYPRLVRRVFNEEYRREREFPKEFVTFQGNEISSASRYAFIETPAWNFVVQPVPDELGPSWSKCLGIEYRDEWGRVPTDEDREAIGEIVSFILGRQLINIGCTEFDEAGNPYRHTAKSPEKANLVALCLEPDKTPINLEDRDQLQEIETVLKRLVPMYLAQRGELRLKEALRSFWLAQELPVSAGIPIIATSMEILNSAWFKSSRSKTKGKYLPKKKFDALLKDELEAIEKKLEQAEYKDQMMRRLRDAWVMGTNDKFRLFFSEIGLPTGEAERKAVVARNPLAHGSSSVSKAADSETAADAAFVAYQTLFNRV